jgi:glycosyltransferase involved in cell wall biosynthesis
VPGPLQAAYASHIGFQQTEVIPNLLSGNHALFSQAAQALEAEKLEAYPQRFLYVGRFAEMKGLDILLQAYNIYKAKYAGTWGLTCIGNGPLRHLLAADSTVEVEEFMSQRLLIQQAQQAGALILPSRFEPWGVVVHEFAAAGLPLILSENVGARAQFLTENVNGYTSYRNCPNDLAEKMHLLSTCDQATLITMGHQSCARAGVLTPTIAANSLLSALKPKVSRR